MILFLCRLRAANSARFFDTLRGSCREAGPFLRAAKGAFKDGKADCHTSDIGHWFAMTGSFTWGAVCGGTHGSRPTAGHFVGQGPCALPRVQCKEESPSHGFAVPAPFRQGGLWGRGRRIATTSLRTGLAMTGCLQGVRGRAGRRGEDTPALRRGW